MHKSFSLFLLFFSVFVCNSLYSILTEVTLFETPTKTTFALFGDSHDGTLDSSLILLAEEQSQQLDEDFPRSRVFAECPRGNNADVLGLIKKQNRCTDLENRGISLTALAILECSRMGFSLPKIATPYTVADLYQSYEETLNGLKDKCYPVSALLSSCERTFGEVTVHFERFKNGLEDHKITPDDSIAKLYDIERPLGLINTLHDGSRKMFDLGALHTVYTHMQHNNTDALVCVGTRHSEPLKSWFSQLDGYRPLYSCPNAFDGGDTDSLRRAALKEIEFKKAAGLLSSGIVGTVSGYAQRCSKFLCPSTSAS